jgi:hypothetical protein
MQLTFSTYEVAKASDLPKIGSRVRQRSSGRWFVIREVTDERAENCRIMLSCISLDHGGDAILFFHEIDVCL